MKRFGVCCTAVLTLLCLRALADDAPPAASPAGQYKAREALYPPWQGGENDDATDKGFNFTVPPVDVMVDFHGSVDNPALVLYASGNYYFAMKDLVAAFEKANPTYLGKVFYETLPPGILLKQMAAHGTVTAGNLTFTVPADIFMAEERASKKFVTEGRLVDPVVSFATNDLTIMVPAGNPAHISGLKDLGRDGVPVVMPNPTFEGVAKQIRGSLVKAGGEDLANAVYGAKVKDGTTILTRIHHRQTPLFLMQGVGEAGVTWTSEAIFQEKIGHKISHVVIPLDQNTRAIYSAAMVPQAPHPDAAHAWLAFLQTDAAFAALQPYGFQRISH